LYGSKILSKNWDIWNKKFQQNYIVYYIFFIFLAFLAFCFLFRLSKLVLKLWNFLWYFIGRVKDFTNDFWKILKVALKRILICEIFFFFKILWLNIWFFIFLLFLTFYFQFRPSVVVKKFQKFLCFSILWIRDFIKRVLENHGMFFKKR